MNSFQTTLISVASILILALPSVSQPAAVDSHIHARPSEVIAHPSPWMYGSCIEDVNHEIYGGLYAQRIFGESFEEPPNLQVLGWNRFGGSWQFIDESLNVATDAGAKMVRSTPQVGDGNVAVDVHFADAQGDNAGLILRVADPHTGPDPWVGYEVSLSIKNQALILGRHRNNWELLRSVPIPIALGRWYRLIVDMSGSRLRVSVDDRPNPLLEFDDGRSALPPGRVGLRTWNSNAAFRNLVISYGDKSIQDPLDGKDSRDHTGEVSGMWEPIVTAKAKAHFAWDRRQAANSAHSQEIQHLGGTGAVGIANRGLNRWGIAVRKGREMRGSLYLRGVGTPRVTVALQSADGSRTYARQSLAPAQVDWSRREFTLRPTVDDPSARFALWLDSVGSVAVDQVYLSDTGKALFHGLPFRADIGNGLVDEELTFLRYAGTMVNAPEYRWKQMIGPRDRRPQYRGNWYPFSTNGFGIEEFLQFCEAAHIEPAFAINIDEAPEDAADLVEYLNGPASSAWGAKRAANGHPAPYRVRYIEIGNEEGLDGNQAWYRRYLDRFQKLYAAMRPKDPSVHYVIAAWWNPNEPLCRQIAQALSDKAALWDVHVDGDGLRDADRTDRTLAEMQRLFQEWIPGSSLRACIFEENGGRHDLQRALGHARNLNVALRHGDFVRMDCPANCLQPFGQNDNGWDQGQLFFLPDRIWGMPPYYVQQMAARNRLPLCIACVTDSPDHDLDVTALRSEDGKIVTLQVVNSGSRPHRAQINLDDFLPASNADAWMLAGALTDVNTPDAPVRIRPVQTRIDGVSEQFEYPFLPYSYTILRLRRR